MHPFQYARAANADEALATVGSDKGATYLAGGTCLIDLMKLNVMSPEKLVDINRLDLTGVEKKGDSIFVGALVKNSDLGHHPLVEENFPVLSEALMSGASAQLRNMATVGGNIMQRTRCYYFRDTATPCNKRDPGSGCPAIKGFNRMHAIFGTSEKCIAAHPSDMCVALVALDAVIHTRGPKGVRQVPIGEFYLLPGDHPELETVLLPGELIESVEIPLHARGKHSHYLKVRDRASYAFALVSAAVAVEVEGGMIKSARVALGGVGTRPWRAKEAEEALVGKPASKNTYANAALAAVKNAIPQKHNAFKVELTKRTLVRALDKVEAKA
jgi:xanthine dehydrogenase YagS FAD-binding subunit